MSQPGHAVQLPAIILESSVFLPHNTMRLDLHAPIARALLDRWTDQSASSGSHVAVFSSIPSTITFPSGSVTRLRSGARVFNTGCVAEIVSASSLASSAGRSAEKDRLLTILLKGLKRCTLVREESALSVKSDAEGDTPSSSVPVMTVQPFALEADGSSVSDLEGRLRKTALLLFVANPHLRSTQLLRAVNQSNTPIEQIGDILMQSLEDKEFFVDKLQALACARLTVYIRTVLEVATKVTATISAAGPSHQQGLSKSALSVKKETFGGSAAEEDDVQELREKWTKKSLPAAVDGVIGKELKRMTKMPSLSPEYSVIRTYIETLLDFPWNQLATSSNLDLTFAQQVLDREHFGLQDIKKRVLQYIAVMILLRKAQEQKEKQEELSEEKEKGELKDKGKKELPRHASRAPSTILCLVGPPGVGKTSLGQSIAKVLQRPFQRIALGGVFDEAELRGHRRTYIGSLPGNIIQAVKRSGVMNPVILLDEVDKAGVLGRGGGRSGSGGGGGGDGAIHAALLEILDPDQNHSFLDHYLAVPVDLSQVVFIATANSLDPLPGPLRDRMEVIHVSGYTVSEKMQIARRHLVSREIASSGLSTSNLCIADDAMEEIVVNYTREAGVRQLRREIATICRHVAVEMASRDGGKDTGSASVAGGANGRVTVNRQKLASILGPPKYAADVALSSAPPGVVAGLAWTTTGGDLLFIESVSIPLWSDLHESSLLDGKRPHRKLGSLTMTGNVGKVMEESGDIALHWLRSHMKEIMEALGSVVDRSSFHTKLFHSDIRVHLPSGAVPKDGPSAGCALLSAILSSMLDLSVSPTTAMTGEITLRGAILPVGGIKEKVLVAARGKIRRVILPDANRKDTEKLDTEVMQHLQLEFVDNIVQLIRVVFLPADVAAAQSLEAASSPASVSTLTVPHKPRRLIRSQQ